MAGRARRFPEVTFPTSDLFQLDMSGSAVVLQLISLFFCCVSGADLQYGGKLVTGSNVTLIVEEYERVDCLQLTGPVPTSIEWYDPQGQLVSTNDRDEVYQTGDGGGRVAYLNFRSYQQSQGGKYECRVALPEKNLEKLPVCIVNVTQPQLEADGSISVVTIGLLAGGVVAGVLGVLLIVGIVCGVCRLWRAKHRSSPSDRSPSDKKAVGVNVPMDDNPVCRKENTYNIAKCQNTYSRSSPGCKAVGENVRMDYNPVCGEESIFGIVQFHHTYPRSSPSCKAVEENVAMVDNPAYGVRTKRS